MKIKLIILSILTTVLFACKNTKSKNNKTQSNESISKAKQFKYELNKDNTTIAFTAYKTSEKIAVSGKFTKFDVIENGKSDNIREALNNTSISIPINGIKTNDTSRDYKIMKFFFGSMIETTSLLGKLKFTDDKNATVDLTMNGVTKELTGTYLIQDNNFKFDCILDINKWNAQESLKSLNNICKDLHMGKDGVSKTWNVVNINISSEF